MKKNINYMLYDNKSGESLAFGDIEYVTEHLRDFITRGKSKNVDISPTQASVLKALREYNLTHSYSLNLFKHLKK